MSLLLIGILKMKYFIKTCIFQIGKWWLTNKTIDRRFVFNEVTTKFIMIRSFIFFYSLPLLFIYLIFFLKLLCKRYLSIFSVHQFWSSRIQISIFHVSIKYIYMYKSSTIEVIAFYSTSGIFATTIYLLIIAQLNVQFWVKANI